MHMKCILFSLFWVCDAICIFQCSYVGSFLENHDSLTIDCFCCFQVRVKPKESKIEVDFSIDADSENYDQDAAEPLRLQKQV